jgi:hypothetical protein
MDEAGDATDAVTPERNCMKEIRGHRDKNGQREYLIRWKGKPSSDETWVPMALVADAQELVDDYQRRMYGDLPAGFADEMQVLSDLITTQIDFQSNFYVQVHAHVDSGAEVVASRTKSPVPVCLCAELAVRLDLAMIVTASGEHALTLEIPICPRATFIYVPASPICAATPKQEHTGVGDQKSAIQKKDAYQDNQGQTGA